jgi:hypothetical protein
MAKHRKFGHGKRANIERRNESSRKRYHEPSFHKNLEAKGKGKFMQRASKHPGATREYIERKYGEKAFTESGTIKPEYLDRALKDAEREGNDLWIKRLNLAKIYKKYGKADRRPRESITEADILDC